MRELLIRTLSGAVLVAVIIACVLLSPWSMAALALLIVVVGTYEMCRLQQIENKWLLFLGALLAIGCFAIAALVALNVLSPRFLNLEMLLFMVPFLVALFTTTKDFKSIAAFTFGSMVYLSLPCALMLFLRSFYGYKMLLLVFALLWVNDIFAYLSGRLLGKHKLFVRVSPGKTIEGSLGGLLFTIGGVMLFSHYAPWLPMRTAIGLGLIAVVFGTLGDLCESMLKRQAGVKDSGKLIPGHGGILDRFDSVLFAIPFVFVYLLLVRDGYTNGFTKKAIRRF